MIPRPRRTKRSNKTLSHVTWADSVSRQSGNHHHPEDEEEEDSSIEDHEHFRDDQQQNDDCSYSNSSYPQDNEEDDDAYEEDGEDSSSSSSSSSSSYFSSSSSSSSSSCSSNEDTSCHNSIDASMNDRDFKQQRLFNRKRPSLGLPLFTIRNRKQLTNLNAPQNTSNSRHHCNDRDSSIHSSDMKKSNRKRIKTSSSFETIPSIQSLYMKSFQIMISSCSKRSSLLLISSLFVWLLVQYHISRSTSYHHHHHYYNYNVQREPMDRNADLQQKLLQIKKQREKSALESLGSAAGALFKKRKRTSSEEAHAKEDRLPKGCSPLPWQRGNHPTCNDVHSLDLREVLNMQSEE
jgi:hypothetical protein